MSETTLKIATCQFPVSGDVDANAEYIRRYIEEAAALGCDIAHFCETALTGYAGSCPEYGVDVFDVATFDGYDWRKLRESTRAIMSVARRNGIRVILGSTHYVGKNDRPTNCLYIISNDGRIANRYDKRMCTTGDLLAYSPGGRLVTTTVNGFKCGFLICADVGNPGLYQEYKRKGVQVLLHSYYNARFNGPIPNDRYVIPQNRAKAKEYGMWVFANNSSARHSCWPTHIAGPDGSLKKLRRHRPGILIHELSTSDLPDSTVLSSGNASEHPRVLDGRAPP